MIYKQKKYHAIYDNEHKEEKEVLRKKRNKGRK